MEDRPSFLRRKIRLLLEFLRDGVEADHAAAYLREIAEAERELRMLEKTWQPDQC